MVASAQVSMPHGTRDAPAVMEKPTHRSTFPMHTHIIRDDSHPPLSNPAKIDIERIVHAVLMGGDAREAADDYVKTIEGGSIDVGGILKRVLLEAIDTFEKIKDDLETTRDRRINKLEAKIAELESVKFRLFGSPLGTAAIGGGVALGAAVYAAGASTIARLFSDSADCVSFMAHIAAAACAAIPVAIIAVIGLTLDFIHTRGVNKVRASIEIAREIFEKRVEEARESVAMDANISFERIVQGRKREKYKGEKPKRDLAPMREPSP